MSCIPTKADLKFGHRGKHKNRCDKSGVGHLRCELVARLANALLLQLMAAEQSRSKAENEPHPEALDLVMQAWDRGSKRADIERRLALC